jgi:hypothetical protein
MRPTRVFFFISELFSKTVTSFRLNKLHFYLSDEERLSFILVNRDIAEVKCLPIDRFYLEPYIDRIRKMDSINFIVFNFKWFAESYVHRLMVCLPELFLNLDYEDLVEVFSKSKDPETIKSLIKFIDKYCLNVDPFDLLSKAKLSSYTVSNVERYFQADKYLQDPITKSTIITKENVGIDLGDFQKSLKKIQDFTKN